MATSTSLIICHGEVLDVVGKARQADGIWFVPALIELHDAQKQSSHYFRDNGGPKVLCEGDFDEAGNDLWVRSAIPSVFHYAPLHVADGRTYLLDAGFVAVFLQDQSTALAYPFACTVTGVGCGLKFSRQGPAPEVQRQIAHSFWDLLLLEGASNLSDFSAGGIAYWVGYGDEAEETEFEVGCKKGRFYIVDTLALREDEF